MNDFERMTSPVKQPELEPRKAALLVIGVFLCLLATGALLAYLMIASRIATGG